MMTTNPMANARGLRAGLLLLCTAVIAAAGLLAGWIFSPKKPQSSAAFGIGALPTSPPPGARQPNRLAGESSPYLQLHQFNPVHWYPWGSEAFEKAKAEDKPIFLS